jgi:outer membrane usher protein FimD/PapC
MELRATCLLLAALLAQLATEAALADALSGSIRSTPPAEFAELLGTQKTVVDIYFGGLRVGSSLAEFGADTLRFLNPEEVAAGIPNVVNRTAFTARLGNELARNSELACSYNRRDNCGTLTTENVDIIFDEARFRVDVFVHPGLLLVSGQTINRYLPEPASRTPALVQNLNAIYSQDSTGTQRHNLAGLTYIASGMQRVFAQWNQTDASGLAVQEMAWQMDTRRHEYSAGLFQSRTDGLSLTASELLLGAGFGKSFRTRTDLEYMQGTDITVFLPTRSQVEIFRDGRLLASRIHDAGNVRLDTSRLPAGAYDIEIRIRGIDESLRTVTRAFVKSNRIAPPGEPLYYVEAGELQRATGNAALPESVGDWQLRGGYQARLSDTVAWNAGATATQTHALAEGGLSWLRPRHEVSGLMGVTTQGDYGTSAMANWRLGQASLSLFHRETRRADPQTLTPYQLIASEDSRVACTLAWPAFGGQALASVERSNSNTGDIDTYALRLLRTLRGLGPFAAVLTSEVAQSDGQLLAQVSLSLSRSGRHVSASGHLGGQFSDDGTTPAGTAFGSAQVGWSDGDLFAEDIEAALRLAGDDRSTVAGIDALHASRYGRIEATAEQIAFRNGLAGMRASASYDTNIVVNGNGAAFGGNELASSAVLLDLRGADNGAEFDVLVDGQKRLTLRSGGRAVLPLSAYRRYRIQLLDRGVALVAFDDSPRDVTLYPGNVQTLRWDIQPVRVAVGRIRQRQEVCSQTDNTCTDMQVPLRNAVIEGAWGFAMTDEAGQFQAEVLEGSQSLRVPRRQCEARLPESPRQVNGILDLGDLDCVRMFDAPVPATGPAP